MYILMVQFSIQFLTILSVPITCICETLDLQTLKHKMIALYELHYMIYEYPH